MKTFYLMVFLCLLTGALFAQRQTDRRIAGQITDPHDGTPIFGANLVIRGTTTGTTTDVHGNYQLLVALGDQIDVSYIGLEPAVIVVTKENSVPLRDDLQTESDQWWDHLPANPDDKTLSPFFFIAGDSAGLDQMPLKANHVLAQVAGVVAHVQVQQVYVNQGTETIEATYVFPGSTRAAVHAMKMQLGDRVIRAQIKEKETARAMYEEAREEGKTASLLEQNRPNVFTMHVANILPGDTIKVTMEYTEMLLPEEGWYSFVYPTVVGPRFAGERATSEADDQYVASPYLPQGTSPGTDFSFRAQINTGMPIRAIESPTHEIKWQHLAKGQAEVLLDPAEVNSGNRDLILRYKLRGGKIASGLLVHEGIDENFFLLMVEPPDRVTDAQIPPREYIFILDVSGSMLGAPLDLSKALMGGLLNQLRPVDQFNVLVFSGGSGWLHDTPRKATSDNIKASLAKISKIAGGGGTYLLDALQKGLELSPDADQVARSYVVLTDGFVYVEREAMSYIRDHLHLANLFTVGIGAAPNRYLLEGMAHAGKAEPYFINSQKEVKAISQQLNEAALYPLLSHIRYAAEDMELYGVEPYSPADVLADRPLILFGKYQKRGEGRIRLTGTAGEGSWSAEYTLAEAGKTGNEALPYLWARERIKYLSDWADRYEAISPEAQKQEVTRLGLSYNLLTQYTSFVAIDERIRVAEPEQTKRVQQPLSLPQGVSNAALGAMAQTVSSLSLNSSVVALTEVVITASGASQTYSELSYSMTKVSAQDLADGVSLSQVISAKAAGVNIMQRAGLAQTSVRLRGSSQIATMTRPLYILDGIPIREEEAIQLAPESIGSITLVHGAQASALYGSRARHGVVLLNSKYGWRRPGIELHQTIGLQQAGRQPALQGRYGQGLPIGEVPTMIAGSPYSWGAPIAGSLPREPADFYRSAWYQRQWLQWTANAQGDAALRLHAGHQQRQSVIPGLDARGWSAGLKSEFQLAGIETNLQAKGDWQRDARIATANAFDQYQAGLLVNPPSFRLGTESADAYEGDGRPRRAGEVVQHPIWSREQQPYQHQQRSYSLNAGLKGTLSPSLRWELDYQMHHFRLQQAGGIAPGHSRIPEGIAMERTELQSQNNLQLLLGYGQELNGNLQLKAELRLFNKLSNRMIDRKDAERLMRGRPVSVPYGLEQRSWEASRFDRRRGLTSQVQLDVKSKAYLTLSQSLYKTNSLPFGESRLGNTRAELSVLLSRMVQMSFADELKLYGNWGHRGIEAPFWQSADYRYIQAPLLADRWFDEPIPLSPVAGLRAATGQHWEMGLSWDKRLFSFELSYLREQITDYYLPVTELEGVRLVNDGRLLNSEWKAWVSWQASVGNQLYWEMGVNWSKPDNRIEGLSRDYILGGNEEVALVATNGAALGALVGSRWARDAEGQRRIGTDGFPLQANEPGLIGTPLPDFILTHHQQLRYNAWTMQMDWRWVRGGDLWNGTRAVMDFYGTSAETGQLREGSRVFEGVLADGSPNSQAVALANPAQGLDTYYWQRYGLGGVAEDYIAPGSSLRLSKVSLAWDMPSGLLGDKLHSARVSISGYNLLVFSPYEGIDPAAVGGQLDLFGQPQLRSYQLHFRLTF